MPNSLNKTPQPHAYRCVCGASVYFQNSVCLNCHSELGYDPALAQVVPLARTDLPGQWALASNTELSRTKTVGVNLGNAKVNSDGSGNSNNNDSPRLYYRCANFSTAAACNWLRPANVVAPGGDDGLCLACSLNRTVPEQSNPHNQMLWDKIETAKRRLVVQLLALGLPVRTKQRSPWQDAERGLAFDFLLDQQAAMPVMTGHAHGVITINAEEADDHYREQARRTMQEPYRTLLGHMRHEVGHYYWDRLVLGTAWIAPFRAWFGDERLDYAAAVQLHYAVGAPADWATRHVSAYASSHPWEDWAETWAHYLHMRDAVATARSFGLDASDVEVEAVPFMSDALYNPTAPGAQEFLDFINGWLRMTRVLNELSRSMGERDFYPFVLPRAAIAKLQLVHEIVKQKL